MRPPTARAWITVGLLGVVGCLNFLDRTMIITMRGSILAAIPMTEAQFGLLTSAFLWVYALVSPLVGYLADRYGRSRVIVCSLFVWSIMTWATGRCTTFPELFAIRALMGISEACYLPAALALIADYHPGPTRSFATGLHLTGLAIGNGLGGAGGWIAERYGWTCAFSVFGGFGVGYALVLAASLRDAAPNGDRMAASRVHGQVRFPGGIAELLRRGPFILLLVFFGVLGFDDWMILNWMPAFFMEHLHLRQGMAGLSATTAAQVAGFFGLLIGGFLADRWSRTNPRGRIWVAVIGLCIAAPALFLTVNAAAVTVAIGGFMGYGLTRAFVGPNLMPILCMVSDPRYRATGYGLMNFVGCGVAGVAPYAGGALLDARAMTLYHIFLFIVALVLLCAALLSGVKPDPS